MSVKGRQVVFNSVESAIHHYHTLFFLSIRSTRTHARIFSRESVTVALVWFALFLQTPHSKRTRTIKMDGHQRSYKNQGKNVDDLRRRRNEVTVELRKNKREEALQKKRNIHTEEDGGEAPIDLVVDDRFSPSDLNAVVLAAMSPNVEEKLAAIRYTRKLLSTDKNPPIDEIIDAGMLPVMVKALEFDDAPLLQFEAAWALTNIASGNSNQTLKVVEANAVPHFIRLLSSSNENVAEQSLWSLGKMFCVNRIGGGIHQVNFAFR